ncbi:hypothetical protein TNCV_2893951 [Trichonephila clavipes]|nr:hypothetical protein TNCV_2893951 [Trichonephila clavipes]
MPAMIQYLNYRAAAAPTCLIGKRHLRTLNGFWETIQEEWRHEDSPRQDKMICSMPDLQLTPNHILECPTVATKLLKMGMVPLRDSLRELLYSPDAPRIAEAVIKTFDGI